MTFSTLKSNLFKLAIPLFFLIQTPLAQVPDFSLTVTPDSQEICTPNNAIYSIDVGSILNYSDPVTLSSSGEPSGTSASFNINPVLPMGSSILTISNTGLAVPGSYLISVVGVAPTSTHTSTVNLSLVNSVPGPAILSSPADGATNVPLLPNFAWNSANTAGNYNVRVAEDPSFNNLALDETVMATSYTPVTPLQPNMTYYWRIVPANACGSTIVDNGFSFTTGASTSGTESIPTISTIGLVFLLVLLSLSGLFIILPGGLTR